MAAGRTTGNGNEVRVAAVVGDVRLDPREGALDVNDVIGPRVARAVPVIDRHADPAQLRKVAHQWMGLSAFVSRRPRTAGDLEQHRRLSGEIEIGTMCAAERATDNNWRQIPSIRDRSARLGRATARRGRVIAEPTNSTPG